MSNALSKLNRLPGRFALVVTAFVVCAVPLAYAALFMGNARGALGGAVVRALLLSLGVALAALAAALPLSLCYAVAILTLKPGKARRGVSRAVRLLGTVPPVVCALAVIVPVVSAGGTPSPLWAICALTLACLPRGCAFCEDALLEVPERYALCSLSLGGTRTDALFGAVFTHARRRLISSALLVAGIAVDQLALMQLAMGFAPGLTPGGSYALPSLMLWAVRGGDTATAAAAALALLLVSCALSLGARRLAEAEN